MNRLCTSASPGVATSQLIENCGQVVDDVTGTASVMLASGQWLCGRGDVRASALVGAGVALALWSPRILWGGMCCFTHVGECSDTDAPLGRESVPGGRELVTLLERRLKQVGAEWHEVELTLAGGAHRLNGDPGAANVTWVQGWAQARSLVPRLQDVGGRVLRRVTFHMADGSVHVAHGGRLGSQEL